MKRRSLLLGSAALLAGCGGGSRTGGRGTGRATFTVEWPRTTTRLIPQASNSIAVEIYADSTLVARQVIARPGSTLTFDYLPGGSLLARAFAYPSTDGTGIAQASGETNFVIQDEQVTQVPLTMQSTIASFEITPVSIGVGQTYRLMATARDAGGGMVLVSQHLLRWELISGVGNATWDPDFKNLTGVQQGTVTFRKRCLYEYWGCCSTKRQHSKDWHGGECYGRPEKILTMGHRLLCRCNGTSYRPGYRKHRFSDRGTVAQFKLATYLQ
jgi:hypothetical protein